MIATQIHGNVSLTTTYLTPCDMTNVKQQPSFQKTDSIFESICHPMYIGTSVTNTEFLSEPLHYTETTLH